MKLSPAKNLNRRDLLRAVGAAALVLPGLELFQRSASGQSAGNQAK